MNNENLLKYKNWKCNNMTIKTIEYEFDTYRVMICDFTPLDISHVRKTPTFTLKKYKNVKSILMVLLFLLLFGWRRSERRNMILKFCWSCLFFYPTFR